MEIRFPPNITGVELKMNCIPDMKLDFENMNHIVRLLKVQIFSIVDNPNSEPRHILMFCSTHTHTIHTVSNRLSSIISGVIIALLCPATTTMLCPQLDVFAQNTHHRQHHNGSSIRIEIIMDIVIN